MMLFLIVTHIYHRKDKPVEGPFSSVTRALTSLNHSVEYIGIPLVGYEAPIEYCSKKIKVPSFLGKNLAVKYITDFIITKILTLIYLLKNYDKEVVLIGIDPLSTLPLILFKYIFDLKLVFYSVDYSRTRFGKGLLQSIYETTNMICAKCANQVWVVSEYLQKFSDDSYGTKAIYIPNSFSFDESYFLKNKPVRAGNKIVWTGSVSTDKQMHDIFRLSQKLQQLRPELEFWYIPSFQVKEFTQALPSYNLNKAQIFDVAGQKESRELVSQCDLGLAIYDKNFGSTEFIEPIKVWEYMLCGLPFMLSKEASINKDVKNDGVVYILDDDNKINDDQLALKYISKENLLKLPEKCLDLAKKYAATNTIGNALRTL